MIIGRKLANTEYGAETFFQSQLVIGVPECPKGTSYQDRISSDHSSVLRVLESAGSSLSTSSLRDCLRLGKYKDDASIPRPLLVKFNGIRDVQFILRNRTKLVMDSGSKIFVRKDLSKEERHTESLLLTERRTLLGEGIQSSRIRIKGSQLFVDAKLFGQVRSSVFTRNPNFEAVSQLPCSSSNVRSVSPGGSTDVDPHLRIDYSTWVCMYLECSEFGQQVT